MSKNCHAQKYFEENISENDAHALYAIYGE